jgi:hypothetical protein
MVQAASGRQVKPAVQNAARSKKNRHARSATVGDRFRSLRRGSSVVPQIRLAGQWLADAGFNIGDRLTVHVHHQQLQIFHATAAQSKSTFG